MMLGGHAKGNDADDKSTPSPLSSPNPPRLVVPQVECRLRIIAVNDVYVLGNFPRLKTLIDTHAAEAPNSVTTLAGDFLAPSLLSSIDQGRGMVSLLNALPVDLVCFGNHETDIPHACLLRRIEEFHGTWLNTNMPTKDFAQNTKASHAVQLTASDGSLQTVAFMGFLIGGGKFLATYRDGAFGGSADQIVPVLEAAPAAVEKTWAAHPGLLPLGIVPLTHQDMDEDVELARSGLFPVVVGGHDHSVIHSNVPVREGASGASQRSCPVIKAGMDAHQAAVIDLVWKTVPGSSRRYGEPSVSACIVNVADYEPCPAVAALVERTLAPVRELEAATLYELDERGGERYSSVGMRYGPTTMGTFLLTALRRSPCLHPCDAVVLNSGAIRAEAEYGFSGNGSGACGSGDSSSGGCAGTAGASAVSGAGAGSGSGSGSTGGRRRRSSRTRAGITFADLRRECPFESEMVTLKLPGSVFRDAVRVSRKKWGRRGAGAGTGTAMAEGSTGMEAEGQSGEDGELPEEAPEAFQCDDGVRVEVRWQSDDDDDYDGEEKGGKGKEKTDGKGKGKKKGSWAHIVTHISDRPLEPDTLYAVGCDHYDIRANPVLSAFAAAHPDDVPHFGGSPALPIMVEYFCTELWRSILHHQVGDGDGDGDGDSDGPTDGDGGGRPDRAASKDTGTGKGKGRTKSVHYEDLERFFRSFEGESSSSTSTGGGGGSAAAGKADGLIDAKKLRASMTRARARARRRKAPASSAGGVEQVATGVGAQAQAEDGAEDTDSDDDLPSAIVVRQMIAIFDPHRQGSVTRQRVKEGLIKGGVYEQGHTPHPTRGQVVSPSPPAEDRAPVGTTTGTPALAAATVSIALAATPTAGVAPAGGGPVAEAEAAQVDATPPPRLALSTPTAAAPPGTPAYPPEAPAPSKPRSPEGFRRQKSSFQLIWDPGTARRSASAPTPGAGEDKRTSL